MEALHLPNNLKVNFAACEVQNQFTALQSLGVNYGLFTAFPFVERMVFEKKGAPIMPMKWMTRPEVEIPQNVCNNMKHVIQDSGLFTLMFGSRAGKKDENTVNKWYEALVEFTLNHGCNCTCVEVDCQKILGVDKAWEFRQRMRNDLPNNRIINVFHIEDGRYGLDKMIEFSDYIAISVPELRILNKKRYVPAIAEYIKSKKPSIDIHLLGCTELKLMKECKFCTSCDSTTWTSARRYGYLNERHISDILTHKMVELMGKEKYDFVNEYNNETYTNCTCLQIEILKRLYEELVGPQDYK